MIIIKLINVFYILIKPRSNMDLFYFIHFHIIEHLKEGDKKAFLKFMTCINNHYFCCQINRIKDKEV